MQTQTDVLKDQAQREADERKRKEEEEERKAADEAAAASSSTATGSLFVAAPKKTDSKDFGSSGGKLESYFPNCPQLEIKDHGRKAEINTWLCLLDERFAADLQEAVSLTTPFDQGKLAPEAGVRSAKLFHWLKQTLVLGAATREEALSLRESMMRLDISGLKALGCPTAGDARSPLDTCLFLEQEFNRLKDQCASFADLQLQEVDQIMIIMRCLPQEIHRHLASHGKPTTMKELLESFAFYEGQSRALEFARGS